MVEADPTLVSSLEGTPAPVAAEVDPTLAPSLEGTAVPEQTLQVPVGESSPSTATAEEESRWLDAAWEISVAVVAAVVVAALAAAGTLVCRRRHAAARRQPSGTDACSESEGIDAVT